MTLVLLHRRQEGRLGALLGPLLTLLLEQPQQLLCIEGWFRHLDRTCTLLLPLDELNLLINHELYIVSL